MDKPRVETGRIWEGYSVEAYLGEGANAAVYLVQHIKRKSHHALKVFRRQDSRRKLRIEQEAVLRDNLKHPNIIRATHGIDVDGAPALVMDFVEGPTLERWLTDDRHTDLSERLEIYRGIVEGIRFAHSRGIVHRDLKPSNVLLQPSASGKFTPRIGDFGLAKAMAPEVGKYGGLTTVNTGLGTAGYAAPEQVRDASSVDHRADLYSLGCILYEMVCGLPPFAGLSAFDTLLAQRDSRYRRPEDVAPGLPPALYDLIRQLMSARAESRPADADEILRRLDAIVEVMSGTSVAAGTAAAAPPSELGTVAALCVLPALALAAGAVLTFLL
ncbi:MAG: serine/threonine-protein kinase [Myxococcota bacterium]